MKLEACLFVLWFLSSVGNAVILISDIAEEYVKYVQDYQNYFREIGCILSVKHYLNVIFIKQILHNVIMKMIYCNNRNLAFVCILYDAEEVLTFVCII